jgi:hypothetical protein
MEKTACRFAGRQTGAAVLFADIRFFQLLLRNVLIFVVFHVIYSVKQLHGTVKQHE